MGLRSLGCASRGNFREMAGKDLREAEAIASLKLTCYSVYSSNYTLQASKILQTSIN